MKTKTAKAKAESKFKMVGTKLNEESYNNFEKLIKERGFENTSSYIKFLIDFDSVDSVEEERKQNEIMTNTIEVLRNRISELEKDILIREEKASQMDLLRYIAQKVKTIEEKEEKPFLKRLLPFLN